MDTQYNTPAVDPQWASSRETHPAVAMAIHAIADSRRSPEAIWEDPTKAEIDHVRMAVENYIDCGLFEPTLDGAYSWGQERVIMEVKAMPTDRETTLQRRAEEMVQREVNCCLSSLVATLARGYSVLGAPVSLRGVLSAAARSECEQAHSALRDLADQAFELAAPIDDWEEAAREAGFVSGDSVSSDRDCWPLGYQVLRSGSIVDPLEDTFTTWQDACEHDGIDPYQREVFEHWSVSTWLADRLLAHGEKVDKDFAGLCVWARTTCGQGIASDGVIRRIVEEMDDD